VTEGLDASDDFDTTGRGDESVSHAGEQGTMDERQRTERKRSRRFREVPPPCRVHGSSLCGESVSPNLLEGVERRRKEREGRSSPKKGSSAIL
jgi:hypothetical protein